MHNVHVPNQFNSGAQNLGGVPSQTQCLLSPLLDGQQQQQQQHQQKQQQYKATTALRQWRKHSLNAPLAIGQQQQPPPGPPSHHQQQQQQQQQLPQSSAPCQMMPQGGAVASVARVAPQIHYHHQHQQQSASYQIPNSYHHHHHQQIHHQSAPPPPVRYSEIVEVPTPPPGPKIPLPPSNKDVEMMLGHWGSWGQHHGNEHLGYAPGINSHHQQRSYGVTGSSGASGGPVIHTPTPKNTAASFSAETNNYLAQLHKINPRVAQSIINDSFLDQSRLFNTHVYPPPPPPPPMYNGHKTGPYQGYYAAPKQQPTSPTASYKYNAHVEQPTRNISPRAPPGYQNTVYQATQTAKQPYYEYSQHYQHRSAVSGSASAAPVPKSRSFAPPTPYYNARPHQGPPHLQSSLHPYISHRRSFEDDGKGGCGGGGGADNCGNAGGGGGGNINLKTFLESWNEEDVISGEGAKAAAKGTAELYVYDSTDISTDAIGQYLHIQQVDKLPENIRGYIPAPEEASEVHRTVIKEPHQKERTETKENEMKAEKAMEIVAKERDKEIKDNLTKSDAVVAKEEEPKTMDKDVEEAQEKPLASEEDVKDENVPEKAEIVPIATKEPPEVVAETPEAVENVESETKEEMEVLEDVMEEEIPPEQDIPAEDDLQIEKVQINNREALKINQNNIMLQIGDDMCLEIDVNSDGEKIITVKTCQGSWQLSEVSAEGDNKTTDNNNKLTASAVVSDAPVEDSAFGPEVVESECTTEVLNIQDWVCEEEVKTEDAENAAGDMEMIQENKIESSDKTKTRGMKKKRMRMKRWIKTKNAKQRAMQMKKQTRRKTVVHNNNNNNNNNDKEAKETTRKTRSKAEAVEERKMPLLERQDLVLEGEVLDNNNDVLCNLNDVQTVKNVVKDVEDNKLAELPSVYLLRLDEIVQLNAVDVMIGEKLKEIEEIEMKSLKMLRSSPLKSMQTKEITEKEEEEEKETKVQQVEVKEAEEDVEIETDNIKVQEDSTKLPEYSSGEAAIQKRRLSLEEYNYRKRLDLQQQQQLHQTLTNDLLDVKSMSRSNKNVPLETIPLTLPLLPKTRSKDEEEVKCHKDNVRQLHETRDIVRRFLNKECLSRSELLKVQEIIKFKSLYEQKKDGEELVVGCGPESVPECLGIKKRKRRRFRNLYSDEDEEESSVSGVLVQETTSSLCRDPRLLYGKRSVSLTLTEEEQKKEVPTIIIKKNGSAYSSSVKP